MRSGKELMLLIILSLFPLFVFSKESSEHKLCLFLGSKPSLIIKFKNISSRQNPSLKESLIRKLSSTKAIFTMSRAMSGDAFIVFFSPKEFMLSGQIRPGCYSEFVINSLINELMKNNDTEYIVPNILLRPIAITRHLVVPIIGPKQWNLLTPPGGIDAQTAFNITTGSTNAITAVLDTGILPNNSLTPNLLSGVTFNNNGSSATTGATPSCDSSCADNFHGTHVSGIVSASGVLAYGESIYGVAPTSKILPINVFTKFTSSIICTAAGSTTPCLLNYTSDLINAINWLNGEAFSGLPSAPYVTTVNMSLGGTGVCSIPMQAAMNQLFAKDISIAVAAGNGNTDASTQTPANCNGVMAVAATGPAGYGAFYSNYGTIVPFAAPGGDCNPPGSPGCITDEIYSTVENAYAYVEGTSMASPHVAGLGALLYSLDPTLTSNKVLNLIQTTTTPFPPGGPGNSCTIGKPCGTGIINANSAVIATVAQAPILSWNPNLSVMVNSTTQATLQWQPGIWQPNRSTTIVYTVDINGVDVSNCQNISATFCILNNLVPNTNYTVFVKASDVRNIYGPLQSPTLQFTTPNPFIGPTLTVAARNPLKTTEAFIYYSSLGSGIANSYVVNGISGATVVLDNNKNRFIVDNISTPRNIENVSISAIYGTVLVQSNLISIPNIL